MRFIILACLFILGGCSQDNTTVEPQNVQGVPEQEKPALPPLF